MSLPITSVTPPLPDSGRPWVIIPARGGSKGVPRKNVRLLAGRPLLAHTLLAAAGVPGLGSIIVSTDDAEIAAVARTHGAHVVERPAAIAGDEASSESALLHVLNWGIEKVGGVPDHFLFLQCTSPLMLAEDISGVLACLADGADSAFSATRFHHFIWDHDDSGAHGINHDAAHRSRRQDRTPQWLENGAIYGMRTAGFLAARHRFFGQVGIHPMPPERSFEIDDPTDFAICETLMRARQPAALDLLPAHPTALIMDFDGVMTDDRVLVDEEGREAVFCHRGDGLGLEALRRRGFPLLILSKEKNPVVSARGAKLGIPVLQGVEDKAAALGAWLKELGIDAASTIYIGNDRNDLPAMALAGCGVAPADAMPEARAAASLLLTRPGGGGAVRELCDLIATRLDERIKDAG